MTRILGALGRTCIAAGVLVLLFVAHQLWATSLLEARSQDRLRDDFEALLEAQDEVAGGPQPAVTTTTATTMPLEPLPDGSAVARLRIPRIGLDKIVVEGVSPADLKQGPGHYPTTPLPGQEGNAAIAGHRTTYGAPFNRIDELQPGDEILVQTRQGEFRYEMSEQLIVSPDRIDVLEDKGDDRLTLTACHPEYSARQRIVVVAELDAVEEPLPAPVVDASAPAAPVVEDLDGESGPVWPAVLLGGLCAAIALLAWLLGRVWRRWPAYALAVPFLLVGLFYFFEELSRLLPANY